LAKPFSIQAPEDIAKEYAGNKQRIAQAAQMGTVDPTAAVLAGMFIDRMRSAQVMEAGQMPSVAQQVLGGQPPQGAGAPPPPPPMGMAPPPQGMPMPPQDMGMAPPPPQDMPMPPQDMAPQGMAEGGIAGLPIPDTMFDEPTNGGFDDGYAGGGMVAFSDGGMANLYDDVEYFESGGNQNAVSKAGARGVMQLMPGTMKDPGFGVPSMAELRAKGLSEEDANRLAGQKYLDAMYRKYGDEATALAAYNWGPGNVDKWLKTGADPKKLPAETKKYINNILGGKASPKMPERDFGTAEGRSRSVEDEYQSLQRRFGPTEKQKEVEDQRMARAEEMASPEYYEAQRKDSMWETLAAIGFNMASSKSPYLLQAVSEAAAAAMPGARADKKERKALKDRALDIMGAINDKSRKENLQLYGIAQDAVNSGMQQKQFDKKLELDERQLGIAERKLDAEIKAMEAGGDRISFDELLAAQVMAGEISEPMAEALLLRRGGTEGGGQTIEDIRAKVQAGRTGGSDGASGFSEGQTSKDTKGRTIVFQGGQWVYP
jgi:hypothetical protein